MVSPVRHIWPRRVSPQIPIIKVNHHSLIVVTHYVKSISGEAHVCHWRVYHIRNSIDKMELILSP